MTMKCNELILVVFYELMLFSISSKKTILFEQKAAHLDDDVKHLQENLEEEKKRLIVYINCSERGFAYLLLYSCVLRTI